MGPLALTVVCALGAASAATAADPPPADVLYRALLGEPEVVEGSPLLEAPGRFVGRAVRTRGRLDRPDGGQAAFVLRTDQGRILLRLEPAVAALVASRSKQWIGAVVEVEGFFYREVQGPADDAAYALRAWLVQPLDGAKRAAPGARSEAPVVTLQDLAYGAGRYDGKLVRVRGTYRGPNLEHDLPDASRKGAHDWVLKDGYFAAWVTGRDAPGQGSDRGDPLVGSDLALEVVGLPTTSEGIVHLAAREIEISSAPQMAAVGRASVTGDAGGAALPPHVSFSYPVEREALDPGCQLILQFSKPMDPSRFAAGIRLRYEGKAAGTPRLTLDYRDRYRALVITPEPPAAPGSVVVVELLGGLIDVDGRALTPPEEPLRFRVVR
jgi:hypothetical protein